MSPLEIKRRAVQKLVEAKHYNKEQFEKFFLELYKIESDPFAPVKVSEVFKGINIPDIRKPGQGLEDLWPHFFVCNTSPDDPDFSKYQPDSVEYKRELQDLSNLVRAIRTRANEVNEEATKLCESQLNGKT